MEQKEFTTKNAAETQKLAGEIAGDLMKRPSAKTAAVLALEGELGGGKTTFTQGLAKAFGVKEKILSPTFVIQKRFMIYDLRFKNKFGNLYHIDCYRLEKPEELIELGFDKILKDPKNLIVIEWADKMKSLIPDNAVWVEFEWIGEEERKITLMLSRTV